MCKAIISGLEHTIQNHGLGGMASAYMVLEIAHTHYWARDINSTKSDVSIIKHKLEHFNSAFAVYFLLLFLSAKAFKKVSNFEILKCPTY